MSFSPIKRAVAGSKQARGFRDGLYERLSRRRVLAALTILPALFLFLFLNMVPILWAIAAGFFKINALNPVWEWVGVANYELILGDDAFWGAAWRGAVFTGGAIVIQLTLGVALALLIDRDFKYKYAARTIVMFPYLVPTAVLGFIAIWMNNGTFGITNQILVSLGVISEFIAWYGTTDIVMAAVITTFSWKFTIFVTIMVLAKLQSIPDSFYEAAEVSGATSWDKFRDITLPHLKGVIFIVLLLRGVWTLNKFDIIWVLTRGGPGDSTTTPPVYVFEMAFQSNNLGLAASVSVLLFVVVGIVAILYFRILNPEEEVRVE